MNKKSILQNDASRCYCCMRIQRLECHHVFEGRNRKNSDEDGCVIYLCHEHHTGSNNSVHFNKQLDRIIKERMQCAWMEYYDKTKEDFIRRYRRNYLS